jgi:hypothetical protein
MEEQRTSKILDRWLIIAIFIFTGVIALLSACSPLVGETVPAASVAVPAAAPCPDCEELICPEPVRYEDVWAASPHADSEAEAFTHWNETEPQEIPTECAKCHSRPGFIDFLGIDGTPANQVDSPAMTGTTISCFVCHNEVIDDVNSVDFPSGAKVRMLGPEVRCVLCHQGRTSTKTVDDTITELGLSELDVPSEELVFINSHSTSAATPFGSEVQGAYQYAEKTYSGKFKRGDDFFACTRCHDQHSLELKTDSCTECHTLEVTEPRDIRVDTTDYDGDGDNVEGISYEITTMHDALYEAIQAYADQIAGTPIVYDVTTYPYFFIDTNGNSRLDTEENLPENSYNAWTPRLLRAAYNYNYVTHDPGAYAHNSDYTLQVLYDSLADLGGDVTGMARP